MIHGQLITSVTIARRKENAMKRSNMARAAPSLLRGVESRQPFKVCWQ